jgi:DNA-binding response OmpR family regulator
MSVRCRNRGGADVGHGQNEPPELEPTQVASDRLDPGPLPTAPSRKRILVADDERTIVDLLVKCFIAEGYDALPAVQSLRILDSVLEYRPDLILLDMLMPYLEGEDILRLMKLFPDIAQIPVIVVTAKGSFMSEEQKVELRTLGVRYLVHKPFDLSQLLTLVRWALLVTEGTSKTHRAPPKTWEYGTPPSI